jgi:putative ABC transport system permease protein
VGRLSLAQLRHRTGRSLALLLGVLMAATAFTVLTAASRTSQLRTVGAVSAHFRGAYDILVRPRGARTPLEASTRTVQPNFLTGIYGGITMGQYRLISGLAGVSVAAPVAMVGYDLPVDLVPLPLPAAAAAAPGRELYRYTTTWVSAGGSSRITQPASFVYVTPDRLGLDAQTGVSTEPGRGGVPVQVCQGYGPAGGPFSAAAQSNADCWSRVNGGGLGQRTILGLSGQHPGLVSTWQFPLLIAAVDPAAEARLDGLNHAVTAGRYLREPEGPGSIAVDAGGDRSPTFPVLAAARSGVSEYAVTTIQRLARPAGPATLGPAGLRRAAAEPGVTVGVIRVSAQQAYQRLLTQLAGSATLTPVDRYWAAGPTRYRRAPGGTLEPVIVRNPASAWRSPDQEPVGLDNTDHQYRALTEHADRTGPGTVDFSLPVPRLAGLFDPARIRVFDPLSRVPLGGYEATAAAPADAAARRALGGAGLLPDLNLGGYVSQPVQLVTTLAALPVLEKSSVFSGGTHAADPISVIRVRVAGVTGPDPVSRARIDEVAQQIAVRTGLTVDIVTGSSPVPTTIALPAGRFGQPPLRLTENWVRKGVAFAILTAVDKKSVVLFTLILIVCALFVGNSATAAVRGRRQELAVLACLGWTRPRLFGTILGELAAIGLAAGVAGGLLSLPLAAALGLHASPGRAALAVPAAVALAVLAGTGPAWLAARASPAAVAGSWARPVRRARPVTGITGLAVVNVLRSPGRSLLGAASLAVGVAALTMVTAVTLAFRGTVVGSLLGDGVAVQIRGVDYVAVAATVALGVVAVADVLFLNIRERAPELATIRAQGWPEPALSRLIVTEGAVIGLAGSLAGAAGGLAGAAAFAGQLPARLWAVAAVTVAAGTLVTVAAALLPARLLHRLPTARLLAEE